MHRHTYTRMYRQTDGRTDRQRGKDSRHRRNKGQQGHVEKGEQSRENRVRQNVQETRERERERGRREREIDRGVQQSRSLECRSELAEVSRIEPSDHGHSGHDPVGHGLQDIPGPVACEDLESVGPVAATQTAGMNPWGLWV